MLALALLAVSPVQFQVVVSEFATAAYHAACLTGRVNCTKKVYAGAWNGPIQATPLDGKHFDAFGAVFERFEGSTPKPTSMPLLPNFGGHFPSLAARNRVLAHAFEARDGADFEKRVRALLPREGAERLRQAIEHTQSRLHPWWLRSGKAEAEGQARQIRTELRNPQLVALLRALPRLFEAELPSRVFYINVFPAPMPGVEFNGASFVRNHIPLELGPKMKARDSTWVALHEIAHATYDVAPLAKHRALQTEMQAAAEGPALYAYLNEAVATGMQLLLHERMGVTQHEPYNHPYIPRLGSSTMPLLDEAVRSGRSIFDGFAERYIEAGLAEMKGGAQSPRFLLSSGAVLTRHDAVRQAFVEAFNPIAWVTTEEEWRSFPHIGAVRMMTYDELPVGLAIGDIDAVKRHRAFVYKRGREIYMAAVDAAELQAAVSRLAAATGLAEGVSFP